MSHKYFLKSRQRAQGPKCPKAQVPKCPKAQVPKSPSAQEARAQVPKARAQEPKYPNFKIGFEIRINIINIRLRDSRTVFFLPFSVYLKLICPNFSKEPQIFFEIEEKKTLMEK
jgi:hypothetical protein